MFNAFQTQLVVELLWRATWQSAALAAVVGVLMLVARKQIAPRWADQVLGSRPRWNALGVLYASERGCLR